MTPLQTLIELRRNFQTPMSADQLGELLNAVAWAHREEGYGVLSKPNGSNCRQPRTGTLISKDILMLKGSGRIFDCLIDAEGRAEPTWDEKKSLDPSRWVMPVLPGSAPLPPPPDPPRPNRQYPGDHLGTQIGEYLFSDYAQAGQDPNAGMGVWFFRVAWDVANPPYLTPAQSLEKHRQEWTAILGI